VKMRKTMAMTTAYPSAPRMVKGRGAGAGGGGAGHDAAQSRHEHPGWPCPHTLTSTTYVFCLTIVYKDQQLHLRLTDI
jgi:hypothetical protein